MNPAPAARSLAFGGILVGGALAYFGKPARREQQSLHDFTGKSTVVLAAERAEFETICDAIAERIAEACRRRERPTRTAPSVFFGPRTN